VCIQDFNKTHKTTASSPSDKRQHIDINTKRAWVNNALMEQFGTITEPNPGTDCEEECFNRGIIVPRVGVNASNAILVDFVIVVFANKVASTNAIRGAYNWNYGQAKGDPRKQKSAIKRAFDSGLAWAARASKFAREVEKLRKEVAELKPNSRRSMESLLNL
jgi:hypothetical protein